MISYGLNLKYINLEQADEFKEQYFKLMPIEVNFTNNRVRSYRVRIINWKFLLKSRDGHFNFNIGSITDLSNCI